MISQAAKHLLKHTKENPLPLSWTQLIIMDQCTWKWYLSYIMKYRKFLTKSDVATRGNRFHELAQSGIDNLKINKNKEVDIIKHIKPTPPPKIKSHIVFLDTEEKVKDAIVEHQASIEMLEDWINTKFKQTGKIPDMQTEVYIETKAMKIAGVWVKFIGYIDLLITDNEGKLFIWDFKTGEALEKNTTSKNFGKAKSKVGKGLKQQYFYKMILEMIEIVVPSMKFTPTELIEAKEKGIVLEYPDNFDTHDQVIKNEFGQDIWFKEVVGVGLFYPEDRVFFRRLKDKVPRGTKNTSRFSKVTMRNVEKLAEKCLNKLMTYPIAVTYNPFYCEEWCDYYNSDIKLCNTETAPVYALKMIDSKEELIDMSEAIHEDEPLFFDDEEDWF